MTDINRENLSAAVDGELSKEELRFLLRRLDHDASLIEAWARYNVASASLRRQLTPLADAGFASRVMIAIEHEKAGAASAEGSPRHWLRWSAGGAIAASVAAAALLVSQPTGGPGASHASSPIVASTAAPSSPSTAATGERMAASSGAPANVPTWLSGYSASQLSQRASITLGDPSDSSLSPYADSVSPYQLNRYRAVKQGDGSYLLLIDASQVPANADVRQTGTAGR